jgi:NSS family neurotransmitter:Na+ symporter
MTGGYFFALLFFLLLVVAALTSSISVLEVVVAYFVEELGLTRGKATIIAAISITVLGMVSTLSWGVAADLRLFGFNFFDFLDYLASNILLPLGGLFIVIFVAWYLKARKTKEEVSNNGKLKVRYFPTYDFLIKYIAPVAIALVFLNGTGILRYLMGLFG